MTDVPVLSFVDPAETDSRYRVVLWAAPGAGKSVGAASAPGPIVVLSADRPGAYRFARRHHPQTEIREVRFTTGATLSEVYRYLKSDEGADVRTVVLDPFQTIYDRLVDEQPKRSDGDPDWQAINKRILGFLYALRDFDVNVVIVAHERLNDGKKGDGKLYPQVGGPALINKVLAEADIVAHVEREVDAEGNERYMAQLKSDNPVCKESTGSLGARRELDLANWFTIAATDALPPSDDLPWSAPDEPADDDAGQQTLDEAVA